MAKTILTVRQYAIPIGKAAHRSFRTAPSAATMRLLDSLIQATLPILTTYFAALTTTALAEAYSGNEASATEISGGQAHRFALARNFYRNAPIVILD